MGSAWVGHLQTYHNQGEGLAWQFCRADSHPVPTPRLLTRVQQVESRYAMTTTMTAAERAENSRRNGRKSRGPKTPEGKNRSKFNALRHGLRAKTVVLPGEDAQAYQGQIDSWTADRRPRD